MCLTFWCQYTLRKWYPLCYYSEFVVLTCLVRKNKVPPLWKATIVPSWSSWCLGCSPEPVDVLIRNQILDEDETIFLIEESLVWGQQVCVVGVPAQSRWEETTISTFVCLQAIINCIQVILDLQVWAQKPASGDNQINETFISNSRST